MMLALIAIVQSCSVVQDPENWTKEIEDAYKFQISQAMAYTAAAFMELDEDEVDAAVKVVTMTADAFEQQKTNDLKDWDDIEKFKLSLDQWKSIDNTCYYLWEQYHSFDGKVNFSEFVKQPKDGDFFVWITTEKNSDIRVTFKIHIVNDKYEYQVAVDDKDLQVYINNITSAHYEDRLNSAIESAVDDAVNDALIDILTDDEWYQ